MMTSRRSILLGAATAIAAATIGVLANLSTSSDGPSLYVSLGATIMAAISFLVAGFAAASSRKSEESARRQAEALKALAIVREPWPSSVLNSGSREYDLNQILLNSDLPIAYRIVLGWMEFEHKMRNVVQDSTGDDSRGRPIILLIREYVEHEKLAEKDLIRLQRIVNFRNRVAHGGAIDETSVEQDEILKDLVKYLSGNH